MDYLIQPGGSLNGEITVPGDKSVSHRSVMLGAVGGGVTEVTGLLEGMDVLATIHAFREMGIYIDGPEQGYLAIHGNGLHGLSEPAGPLDLGNSGTGMRLMTGLLSAQVFDSELTGDASLSKRPMRRVVNPLEAMGAQIRISKEGTPPVRIRGGQNLHGHEFRLEVASAQVKSALLLAGLYANSTVVVHEPEPTRDHTERMLENMGCEIRRGSGSIALVPPRFLQPRVIQVPADISSAAFFLVGACIAPGSQLRLKNAGINPTRTGVIEILRLMGANIHLERQRQAGGEPVADLSVCASGLKGVEIPESLVASAIDEFPAIVIAAACASGRTVVTGARELRVKESDRIASMVTGLRTLGIEAEELEDGMIVHGGRFSGGVVDSFDDHRISMSFAMAGLASDAEIRVRNCHNVATSFPGFVSLARQAGLNLKAVS